MRGADLGSCFPSGRHYPGIAHLLEVVVAGIAEEVPPDTPLAALPLVCIDTETTGRESGVDRIIELGLVFSEGGEVTERRAWLLNPERAITEEARKVHGITDDLLAGAPRFAEASGEILDALRGRVPVAYNAEFDRRMLHAELDRLPELPAALPPAARRGVEWLDPLVWARELMKQEKSRALGEVAERLGVKLTQAHRATQDAEAALRVLLAFATDTRVPRTYAAFVKEQRRLSRQQEDGRRMWRRG